MSLAYSDCSLVVQEREAQYFVDTVKDGDMQHSKRLMNAKDLKSALTEKDFILDTDGSNEGIGCVLSQRIGNEERVIANFNKSLVKPERNHCVTLAIIAQLLAINKSMQHFHLCLYGQKFLLRTDMNLKSYNVKERLTEMLMP
ncbi:hypothetical protein AVEN_234434-1 [Araneus ventricosus]|uniref:Reverse transcriptase RNase H-like domain-containing protein n=1 Tax=Araneus ventricosus TaxID=182803 RepID=A0A4Y2A8G6_ARAVE|nr:hypothetical protein AVEN_234434-1 [Araneus ventricosus]